LLDEYKVLKNTYEKKAVGNTADAGAVAPPRESATTGSRNPYVLVLVDGNDYIVSLVTNLDSAMLIISSSMMSWSAIKKRVECALPACSATL